MKNELAAEINRELHRLLNKAGAVELLKQLSNVLAAQAIPLEQSTSYDARTKGRALWDASSKVEDVQVALEHQLDRIANPAS
jgi:hypothetical protein